MSFLQPWILFALPLMALPVIIHLIHRNRHRSIRWAATMFLAKANRMNKGMARLRYLLIMAARMAAVAAILFAVSRPLVSGKMGMIGWGKPDATIVLLDRSPSMEAQDLQSGQSKRSTALNKLSDLLQQKGYGSQLVLIDSASGQSQVLESPESLRDLPMTKTSDVSADIPGMLEKALAYLNANESGRADVWVLSDLSEHDWDAESGRWEVIRNQFAEMEGVHHFLLSYPESPSGNLSIRVSNVKRRQTRDGAELILDIQVNVQAETNRTSPLPRKAPVQVTLNQVRTVVEVELSEGSGLLTGYRIPLDRSQRSGWGTISLPGDSNAMDNTWYFVFSEPPQRKAVIVTDDKAMGESFKLNLSIPVETGLEHEAEVVTSLQAGNIDWDQTSLLVWQAPLPSGVVAEEIERFVASGRVVFFFPPESPDNGEIFGMQWAGWHVLEDDIDRSLSWWRDDADLLGRVDSGQALPLDELRAHKRCAISFSDQGTSGTTLARIGKDDPFLVRANLQKGAAYFCATLPSDEFSSMERDAVSFYVMLQRSLELGSRSLAKANHLNAGSEWAAYLADHEVMNPVAEPTTLSDRGMHAGVFRKGDEWVALNRSPDEDDVELLSEGLVDPLFEGMTLQKIQDTVDDQASLASEVWKFFLILMALALLAEAGLCLPEKAQPSDGRKVGGTSGFPSRKEAGA